METIGQTDKPEKKYDCVTEKFVLAFVAADMKIPQKGMNYLKEVLEQLDPEKYMLLIAGKCSDELNEVSKKFEIRNFGYIKEQEKMNEFFSYGRCVAESFRI